MGKVSLLEEFFEIVLGGGELSFDQVLNLIQESNSDELYAAADRIRAYFNGNRFDLCSIINAKSGNCSENCKFCAQSAMHDVQIDKYSIIDVEEAIQQGQDNSRHGVKRFSLVTAGKSISSEQLDELEPIFEELRQSTDLRLCSSMGFLTEQTAKRLVELGVTRYHCNLETAKSYFKKVCTSHSWDDKVRTLKIAKTSGMFICSGGIIGMGESLEQRIELAMELRELGVQSIPINILTPIKNTPFAEVAPLSIEDVLVTVALFRFINPKATIRLAGGRNQFGTDQYKCFEAGANGAIVGNYLTTKGNNLKEDLRIIESMGFSIKKSCD